MLRDPRIEMFFVDRSGLVVRLAALDEQPSTIFENLSATSPWFDSVEESYRKEAEEAHRRCFSGSNPEIAVRFDNRFIPYTNLFNLRLAGCPTSSGEIGLIAISATMLPSMAETIPRTLHGEEYFLAELEAIYASANLGFCLIDRNLTYIKINEILANINRIPRWFHLGRKISEVIPDVYEMIKDLLDRLFETGEPIFNLEVNGNNPRRYGQDIYCLASFIPLRDKKGDVQYISIVVEEQTALVNAKKARVIAEERLNQLLETCNQSTVIIDINNNIIKTNHCFDSFLGYANGELIGKCLSVLVDEADWECLRREIESRLISSGSLTDLRFKTKQGDYFWVELGSFVIRNLFNGEFEGLCLVFSDVSDRKTAEAELKRSEEQHALACRIAHLGHFEWNQATHVIHWSSILYEILEVLPAPGLDLHVGFKSRVHPGDQTRLTNTVEEAVRTGNDYHIEYRLLLPSGTVKHVEEFGRLRVDQTAGGDQVVLYGTIQDITALWKSRVELQEKEERFRLALVAGRMEPWDFDWKSRVLTLSPQLAKLTGIDIDSASPRQALRKILRLFSERDRRRFFRRLRASLRTRKQRELEIRLRLDSREAQYFSLMWESVTAGDGRSTPRTFGVLRDITSKKQLERQKTESEMQFSKILDTALEGAWFFDLRGKTVRINNALSRILGYTAAEMLSKSYLRFVHEQSRSDAIRFFKKCSEGAGVSLIFVLFIKMEIRFGSSYRAAR